MSDDAKKHAVHDFFLLLGEGGDVHITMRAPLAQSLAWAALGQDKAKALTLGVTVGKWEFADKAINEQFRKLNA